MAPIAILLLEQLLQCISVCCLLVVTRQPLLRCHQLAIFTSASNGPSVFKTFNAEKIVKQHEDIKNKQKQYKSTTSIKSTQYRRTHTCV